MGIWRAGSVSDAQCVAGAVCFTVTLADGSADAFSPITIETSQSDDVLLVGILDSRRVDAPCDRTEVG